MSPAHDSLEDSPDPAPKRDLNVSVGVGTIAGLGSGGAAFLLAIIAFASGNRSEETIGALGTGALLIATTLWGRFIQARELAKHPTTVVNTGVVGTGRTIYSEPVSDHDRAIEGAQYDALVNPDDEVRDIHEVS